MKKGRPNGSPFAWPARYKAIFLSAHIVGKITSTSGSIFRHPSGDKRGIVPLASFPRPGDSD